MDLNLSAFLHAFYDLGSLRVEAALSTSGQRQAYALATERGTFVVKLTDPNRPEIVVQADVHTPRRLAARGFPAPAPIAGCDGRFYYPFGDRFVYLYPYLPGVAPVPSDGFYPRLGALLAWLHSLPCDPVIPPSAYRPAEIITELHTVFHNLPPSTMRDHALELLAALPDFSALPTGIIHSDPYLSNLLDDGQTLSLIDWEDGGFAYPLLDVAYALAYLTVFIQQDTIRLHLDGPSTGPFFRENWAAAFLHAYTQMRPLAPIEWELLPAAIRLSYLNYLPEWGANRIIPENYERMQLVDWNKTVERFRKDRI